MSAEKVLEHFREQATYCTMFGSPFTGELIARMADDLEAGGPVAGLVGAWPGSARADVVALRLCGALHAAVLMGRDAALAATYPGASAAWSMDQVWPAARAFLAREHAWVTEFLGSAPQTNETRRSIALLACFLEFAKSWDGPIDTLEIGASAGLNLHWDRFAYRTATWSWGDASPVIIDTDWNGPPPAIQTRIAVRDRAACDLNPLDIRDPSQLLRLKSYIWPDQADRLARFDGAVALAIESGARVERADAAAWIGDKLAARAKDAATIVYHSVFLQYPPRETRAAIVKAIEQEGARADATAPLVWVRTEPEALFGGPRDSQRMVIDFIAWPNGRRRIMGYTDGHVRAVYAGVQA
ncbi:MAG: DUF2332 domain-containing protein [Proteobacteria bacterium]|nr:DUF2332 domain-containing protein [Pseudomonadota bacterium]